MFFFVFEWIENVVEYVWIDCWFVVVDFDEYFIVGCCGYYLYWCIVCVIFDGIVY